MSYDVESSDLAYDGALSRVRIDQVRMPDGGVAEREVVEHPDAVAVVAIDGEGRIVLLRQYRHPVAGSVLEVPAGKLDEAGESPEEAARRELAEEVGLAATRLEPLVTFHNSAGWTDESTTVYLATGLEEVGAPEAFTAEAEEAHMEVVREPFAEVLTAARRGEIADAKTLIGILLAADHTDAPRTDRHVS